MGATQDWMKRQADAGEGNVDDTLLEELANRASLSLRAKRVNARSLVERIARTGASPSAVGSRAAIASVLTHVVDYYRAKLPTPYTR